MVETPAAGIVVDNRLKKASGNKQGPTLHVNAIIRDSTVSHDVRILE